MPALVAGILVFLDDSTRKTWMAGTSPAMTPGVPDCERNFGLRSV